VLRGGRVRSAALGGPHLGLRPFNARLFHAVQLTQVLPSKGQQQQPHRNGPNSGEASGLQLLRE
jgi:hypothetical protein